MCIFGYSVWCDSLFLKYFFTTRVYSLFSISTMFKPTIHIYLLKRFDALPEIIQKKNTRMNNVIVKRGQKKFQLVIDKYFVVIYIQSNLCKYNFSKTSSVFFVSFSSIHDSWSTCFNYHSQETFRTTEYSSKRQRQIFQLWFKPEWRKSRSAFSHNQNYLITNIRQRNDLIVSQTVKVIMLLRNHRTKRPAQTLHVAHCLFYGDITFKVESH